MNIEADNHPVMDTGQGEEALNQETETQINELENEQEEELQEGNQEEVEQTDEEQTSDEEEYIETEFEGRLYNLPKELKDALLRQSDYTKKTMALANERKDFESKIEEQARQFEEFSKSKEQFESKQKAYEADFRTAVELTNIELQLEQFSQLDWNQIDRETANDLDRQERILRDKRERLKGELASKEHQRMQEQQQELAKLEQQAKRTLETEIPGWNAEVQSEITSYAKSLGATDKGIEQSLKYSPTEVKILHKAFLYDKLMKQATAKPIKPLPNPTKKISTGGSSTTSNQLSDKDSVEAWIKKREAQLRRRD